MTSAPIEVVDGANEVTTGAFETANSSALVPMPSGLVTLIRPRVAALGTIALIRVLESTMKLAEVLLKRTEETPLKPLPFMAISVPTGALTGENEVITGGNKITKFSVLKPEPLGLLIPILPVVVPTRGIARIWVSESTVKSSAEVPLNST